MSLNPNVYAYDRRVTYLRVALRSWVAESPAHCDRAPRDYTGRSPFVKGVPIAGDCCGVGFGARSSLIVLDQRELGLRWTALTPSHDRSCRCDPKRANPSNRSVSRI